MPTTEPRWRLEKTAHIITPALVIFREILESNLQQMAAIAKNPSRLRPHCKTHKMTEVVELQLALGIAKHKCATFAEAEMLAQAGAKDIFLAYNLVGANIARAVRFVEQYPQVVLSVTADHQRPVAQLSEAMHAAGQTIDVLLDLDTGQHRTGLPSGEAAMELYRQIANSPVLRPGGMHVYDGHNHQVSLDERKAAVMSAWEDAALLRDQIVAAGWPVPRMVCGGTGSFPIFAEIDDSTIELSPGTCVFHDVGYRDNFPDLPFTPAALILTRVVSRPTKDRVTLDLGYKACASDPPAGQRLEFPDLPDAQEVLQNEEHLVLQTEQAERFEPGDELLAIPRHICPTSALHKQAYVATGGKVDEKWDVSARDRWLEI